MQDQLLQLKSIVQEIKTAKDEASKAVAQQKAVDCLAQIFEPEAKQAVESIAKKIETTQGHYQEYLGILTSLTGLYRKGMTKALLTAGADKQGIDGALMILGQ